MLMLRNGQHQHWKLNYKLDEKYKILLSSLSLPMQEYISRTKDIVNIDTLLEKGNLLKQNKDVKIKLKIVNK